MIKKINFAICTALGIDPARVRSVKLQFDNDKTVCEIAHIVNVEDAGKISEVLKRYELVEKTETK